MVYRLIDNLLHKVVGVLIRRKLFAVVLFRANSICIPVKKDFETTYFVQIISILCFFSREKKKSYLKLVNSLLV